MTHHQTDHAADRFQALHRSIDAAASEGHGRNTESMSTQKQLKENLWRDADTFTRAYIACAFWSSTDDQGEPLDRQYDGRDLADETLAKMVADCAKFQAEQDLIGYPNVNAGHDFWLTRNGHGAGFWEVDFGTEEQCEKLTAASKAMGECNLYVGDDGKLYT